jgi:iron-sulfur cluster assembly protein
MQEKERAMASSRPRPQVIRLTDAAAERIKYVMANATKPIIGVRVGVKNGGCAGMTYTMEYAENVAPADELVEDKGVRVLIDPKAILFLIGTEMDYKVEKLSAQFVFNNPNQTSACGCGESVQLKPAAPAQP